ncbi:hypothetical protein CR513_14918, partial [Mucuna pruriens]
MSRPNTQFEAHGLETLDINKTKMGRIKRLGSIHVAKSGALMTLSIAYKRSRCEEERYDLSRSTKAKRKSNIQTPRYQALERSWLYIAESYVIPDSVGRFHLECDLFVNDHTLGFIPVCGSFAKEVLRFRGQITSLKCRGKEPVADLDPNKICLNLAYRKWVEYVSQSGIGKEKPLNTIFKSTPVHTFKPMRMDTKTQYKAKKLHFVQIKTPDLWSLQQLGSCLKGQWHRTFEGRYGNLLRILEVELQPVVLSISIRYYDSPMRCFTFKDFQ